MTNISKQYREQFDSSIGMYEGMIKPAYLYENLRDLKLRIDELLEVLGRTDVPLDEPVDNYFLGLSMITINRDMAALYVTLAELVRSFDPNNIESWTPEQYRDAAARRFQAEKR